MAQLTTISWTDLSWNPVHGCSIVSTECRNCYAAASSQRYGQTPKPWTPANAAENVLLKPHKLREPLSNAKVWRGLGTAAAAAGKTEGKLVFVNSMSDLFHEQIPDEYIWQVFVTMAQASQHTFQVLTKRPHRMRDWVRRHDGIGIDDGEHGTARIPLPNVWLGVSIGLRHFNRRADLLRKTPAAVRFISAEPLLGPLVTNRARGQGAGKDAGTEPEHTRAVPTAPLGRGDPLRGGPGDLQNREAERSRRLHPEGPSLDLDGIDWVIVGGESGSGHRPMRLEWARDLRDLCAAADTAYFVKQLGGARPGTRLEDLPEDLRIREFPA